MTGDHSTFENDETYVPGRSAEDAPSAVGLMCGDYELLEEVARGGMGVVYRAKHAVLQREAAVKMILSGRFSSASELQRFQVEAEAAAQLDHAAIVPIFDTGEHDGKAWYAMKYVSGGSLAQRMDEFRTDIRKGIAMLHRVTEGVHHAHQRGILHRDLKPGNILIDESGDPLITDLGLAKKTAGDSRLTETGAIIGTPAYMPPEQAGSATNVTTAADIYSLGAIMYEMLTGQPPHTGSNALETVMQVRDQDPAEPRRINRAVDPELELICLKCIARNPEDRYASAGLLADDLNAWLRGKPISLKPPSLGSIASNWIRHHRKLVWILFAILLGIAFVVPSVTLLFGQNSQLTHIYQSFPEAERPWFFALNDVPGWVSFLSFASLIFLIWPSIGLWNALVTRPQSIRSAIGVGAVTAASCAAIVVAVLGWFIVTWNAGTYSRTRIMTLARAVWAPDGGEERLKQKALEMYPGLEEIPVELRPRILADRILTEQVAQGPMTLAQIAVACLLLALPIIHGTVITQILLNRHNRFVVLLVRYAVAWFAATLMTLILLTYPAAAITGSLSTERSGAHLVLVAFCSLALYVSLRRWGREKHMTANSTVAPANPG